MQIAISMRVTELPGTGERLDALARSWFGLFEEILPEAHLVPIPNHLATARQMLSGAEPTGVVLTGGNDWGTAPQRDQTESWLLEAALDHDWPLLGVCRGLQVVNVLLGGRLETHLTDHTQESHAGAVHPVDFSRDNPLGLPTSRREVNSMHDQGVVPDGLAAELDCLALSPGGVVEAVHYPGRKLVAVQWHPERYQAVQEIDRMIIRGLFGAS